MVKYDYLFVYTGEGAIARTLIKRDFFEREYVQTHLTRKEFREKYAGISEKTINQTYKFLYTPEEVKSIQGRKIAFRQRSSNSNKGNWGVPRVLLDKELLEQYLKEGKSKEGIAFILKVAPQTVEANFNFHKIVKPECYAFAHAMPPADIIALEQLQRFLGVDLLGELKKYPQNRDPEAILPILSIFEESLLTYKLLLRKYKRSAYGSSGLAPILQKHKVAGSQLNAMVASVFIAEGYNICYEWRIGNKYFDFKIDNTSILIEVDEPYYHRSLEALENDSLKDALALQEGYTLVRLVVSSKQRPEVIKQKTKECLQKLILDGLLH